MNRRPVHDDPEIELRTWRQFLAVADTLHFGRAAQRLGMTQPPLTQAIQKLEDRLGVELFQRTRRSVALTPAGAALVDPITQLLQKASKLISIAREAATGEVGTLRLGFVSTVGFGLLPECLRAFRQTQPGVTIRLREATTDVQLAAFTQGELDAGFVLHAPGMLPESRVSLKRLSVGIEPLLLALPDTPAVSAKGVKAAELLARPLVIFPRETAPSLYDAVLTFFHRQGVTPVIAQEATQMQTIVNLVSAGLGMALVPQVVARLRRTGVVYRPLPSAVAEATPQCETSLVWPSEAPPVVQRFVAQVGRMVAELAPGKTIRR